MLNKKNRLTKKLFNEVFEKGQNYHSDFLFSKIIKRGGSTQESRFSFSVPTKIEKKVVKRNFLRRKGYMVIRENWEKIKENFDVVIILKKDAEKLAFEEYKKEILCLLKKAKVI